MPEHFDVLVIGAGLSGINAAFHLAKLRPGTRFAILEARDNLGGTWDLFRYPGIRSDSDMHTLGFGFRPWDDPEAIADGDAILDYLHETVREEGLESHIRFGQRVEAASWSSDEARWTLRVRDTHSDSVDELTCGFLWACTGYYRYDAGYTPEFAGRDAFQGTVIHPQHWPEDLDTRGKRIVVIGSGATAVTLVPALAHGGAAHVTMLQRSPTYVLSLPQIDALAERLKSVLPRSTAHALIRWKNILRIMFFYQFSRRFPQRVRDYLLGGVRAALGRHVDVDTHFTPDYDPWDQRVCFVPDGDLFEVLRDGRASVVTDHIDRFTEHGIRLQSGDELEADIIVTATGLQLQVLGGAELEVDGEPITFNDHYLYKGAMLSGVPNHAISLGYTNASWTLKCELVSKWVCRLLEHMDAHGYDIARPELPPEGPGEKPLIDFSSGYIQRALDHLPRQGARAPWRLYQNYILDRLALGRGRIDDGVLHFVGPGMVWRRRRAQRQGD